MDVSRNVMVLNQMTCNVPNCWSLLKSNKSSIAGFNRRDTETVQLLLNLGAFVAQAILENGTTIDLIGAGSTALHYASCGGNTQCCQLLIDKGASLAAVRSLRVRFFLSVSMPAKPNLTV
ncbi:hypothetical protein F2Q69_00001661 [Brassica cretica]|uniref:Uncharacterized protein n=1 Tax=Brassica cretica TaxID=69181 RepID=A0A8S9P1L8_BRACR|nr:hypothetical protein F2Q69_00001661 [Brassica cretica]